MSGVFGIIDRTKSDNLGEIVLQMGKDMSHCNWHIVETHVDLMAGVGLGRIGIGIFNQTPQPVWNADHTIAIVMAGELYNRDDFSLNNTFNYSSDEEIALALFEQKGEDFVHLLNGAFIIAILDNQHQRLIVVNDRFGLYPLFYAHDDGYFIFSPEIKGILSAPNFSKSLNLTAVAEYMRFQQLLGEKTFFEQIHSLKYASVLHYCLKTGHLTTRSYWDFSDIPKLDKITYEEAVEETGRLLNKAVNRMVSGPYRVGVYLSGGLDSRAIIGAIDSKTSPITSITYGQRNNSDVVFAERIANAVGSQHKWFELGDGNWVKEYADYHLTLTEGFHSWIHSHGINTYPKIRKDVDINLTGWALDTSVGGHWWDIKLTQAVDDISFCSYFFYLYNQKYTWPGITEAEEQFLYTDSLNSQLNGLAFASFSKELANFNHYNYPQRAEFFNQVNHNRLSTFYHMISTRSYIEVRCPACDYALFDFASGIPLKLRANRRMEKAIINSLFPSLAKIPASNNNLPFTNHTLYQNVYTGMIKFKNRFNQHIFPLFNQYNSLYADYEGYLRTDLKKWAEDILFDEQTLSRGIFNPQFIRSIWDRHQSGQEIHTIGKIAPLITFEMMMRRFFD